MSAILDVAATASTEEAYPSVWNAFIWAVRSGQYEDTCTPSMRLLTEEREANQPDDSLNRL